MFTKVLYTTLKAAASLVEAEYQSMREELSRADGQLYLLDQVVLLVFR
jgi:hypothetical protein